MLQRLESDPLWEREYENFAQAASFANADEMIGYASGLAALKRLIQPFRHLD